MNHSKCVGWVVLLIAILTMAFATLGAGVAVAQLEEKMKALEEALQGVYDGQPVTLEECIAAGLAGSATIGIYEENLEGTKSDNLAAKGQWLPDLGFSAGWNRSERTDYDAPVTETQFGQLVALDDQGNPAPLGLASGGVAYGFQQFETGQTADTEVRQTFKNLTLVSNWMLFDGLRRSSNVKATSADVRSDDADLAWQNKLVHEEVTVSFYDLARAKAQVRVAEESENVALKEYERSQTYFELGIATKSDVLQAKVQHEQTRLTTVRARNTERQAFVVLTQRMNIPGAARFEIDVDVQTDISAAPIPDFNDLVDQARTARMDLKAAQEDVTASGYRITAARFTYWPQLSIYGRADFAFNDTPFRFGAERNRTFGWGANVNWAIFDRFVTKNRSRQATAQKRRSEYQLRQARLTAENEISIFLNNLIEAKESYLVASETVVQADEDLRLANERFRVGAGTSLDVINAQESLAQARTDEVNSVADFYIAQARIARAVGR